MVNWGFGSRSSPIFFSSDSIYTENAMIEENNVHDCLKKIGYILRLSRQLSAGYTQEELSRECSLSTKTIMRAEQGKPISTTNLLKILDALYERCII